MSHLYQEPYLSSFSFRKVLLTFFVGFVLSFIMPNLSYGQSKMKVVIDPGHGGHDPGAVGSGRYKAAEKDICLDVTILLGNYIEREFKDEVEVIYTRKTDVFIPLIKRTEIANKNKADLFISIHTNSSTNGKASGAETFVMGLHKSEENLKLAQKENAAILLEENYEEKYDGFDPNSPLSIIELSLRQNAYLDNSLLMAYKVQKQFTERVGRKNRGVKQAGFWVISYTTMPSILVELGFISNKEEEDFMNSQQGKEYLASAIYRAFKEYKEYVGRIKEEGGNLQASKTLQAAKEELEKGNEEAIQPDYNTTEEEETSTDVSDTKDEKTTPNEEEGGIVFKVQILTTSNSLPLDSDEFKGLKNVSEHKADGLFKYTIGNAKSFAEAQKIQADAKEKGFKSAFVVAFNSGERINLQDALNLVNK
jgi:N-acetylmuramoyl-L-alanine amidase